jgi:DNA-binding SARP family transcriptional activator/ATP/maltotriose-dependent transcriptional regulator MalT
LLLTARPRPRWLDNVEVQGVPVAAGAGSGLPGNQLAALGTWLDRPALAAALDAAAPGRPVLVTAGPGWGKSAAVAAWAGRRDACWLTLEPADAAAPQLANRILQAARRQLPELPSLLISTGASAAGRPRRIRVGAVVDGMCRLLATQLAGAAGGLVLVLDGLHELPPGGDAVALITGLCAQAPRELRLVLITRPGVVVPLRPGPAAELGPDVLAWTPVEVAAFLRAMLRAAEPELVARVTALTAGRPAAVRLAAALLRSGGAAALPDLAGGTPGVLTRLASEVLATEPEPGRRLLSTAALLGQVDVPMCLALGHPAAATLLPALAERGLLRPGGPGSPLWSVPEEVARQLVTGRPEAGAPAARAAHRGAAGYRAGRAEYAQALRHLTLAGDGPAAEQLLVAHGMQLLADGEAATVLAAARALDLRGPDPGLLVVLGYASHLHGDWLDALALLRVAAGTGPLEPALAQRLGQLYYVTGRLAEAIETFERAGVEAPGTGPETMLFCSAAVWLRAAGADDRARATAARAAEAAERLADPAVSARSHTALAFIAAQDGDRATHDLHHRYALRLAAQIGDHVLQLGLQISRASYLSEEGAPTEAIAEAEAALQLGQDFGVIGYEPMCCTIRARARARIGEFDQALADLEVSQQQWQDIGPSMDVAFGLIVRGDVHCRRGEPGQAQAVLAEALRAADAAGIRAIQVLALAALARATAADDLAAAAELAGRAVRLASGTGTVPALLARGWVALQAGDRGAAGRDAAAARAAAGARRDQAGLAEALELAVLSAPEPVAAAGLLDEAAAVWAELGDPVGDARVRLLTARLAGPSGRAAVDAATRDLTELGVRLDTGVAGALAVPAPRPPIAVRTLGEFRVLRGGQPIPSAEWRSKKARDLFKILVTHRGRPATRERLVNLLWPDDPSDRTANRLSVLLSTLRTVLAPDPAEPDGSPDAGPILADRHTVTLDLSMVELDVDAFLTAAATAQAADRGDDQAARGLLAAAEAAYTGDFLPEDPYDEWAEGLRDLARTTHIAVLRALIRRTGDVDQREHHLRQLLGHDPYDEPAHRQLVQTLRAAGRHGEARRRYRDYAARMAEIGVTPAPFQPVPASRARPRGA